MTGNPEKGEMNEVTLCQEAISRQWLVQGKGSQVFLVEDKTEFEEPRWSKCERQYSIGESYAEKEFQKSAYKTL